MYIVLEPKRSSFAFIVGLLTIIFEAAAFYIFQVHHKALIAGGLALLGLILLAVLIEDLMDVIPPIVIDDVGVLDPRLGVGKLHWSDIEDVQMELSYRHRYLCFRVARQEKYLNKLTGPRKARALFHRDLGFSRFNVDVRQYSVDPLALKEILSRRIASSPAAQNAQRLTT
jgi:hypothetical protein